MDFEPRGGFNQSIFCIGNPDLIGHVADSESQSQQNNTAQDEDDLDLLKRMETIPPFKRRSEMLGFVNRLNSVGREGDAAVLYDEAQQWLLDRQ